MATSSTIASNNQSIFDIAIQVYGDVSKAYQVVNDNGLQNIMQFDITGLTMSYQQQNTLITNYFATNNTKISSLYPIITTNRQFDNSFSSSFR